MKGQVQKLKKPRKDTAAVQGHPVGGGNSFGIGGGRPAPKKEPLSGGQQNLRKPSGKGSSPGSGGGSAPTSPVPGSGGTPPPQSPRTFMQRQQADRAWERVQGDTNYQRYLAALAYGDPGEISRYGQATDSPTSALARIAREEALAQKNLAITRNENNTFFSGKNLDDIATIGNEAAYNRKTAQDEFLKALYDLGQAEKESEEAWRSAHEGADLTDLEDYSSTEPTPQAPAPGSGGGGGATPKPKGGTQVVKPKPKPKPAPKPAQPKGGTQVVGLKKKKK